jgi:hypothetical protein
LDLTSSSDVGVDVVDIIDVSDDPDPWFVLEKAVDEPLQIGIPEIVVEHSNRNIEVLILVRLISTIFPKSGEKSEGESIAGEGSSVEERHEVCLSGGGDFAGGAGAGAQLEGHD